MAHGHQHSSHEPGRSVLGRVVVWLLIAVSAIRGLRRGPGQHHAGAAPDAPGTDAARHGGSTGDAVAADTLAAPADPSKAR
jgi:hypothetical protein